MSETEVDVFVARWSRWRLMLMLLLAFGFVAGGSWMVGAIGRGPGYSRHLGWDDLFAGWLTVAIFSIAATAYIPKLFGDPEVLRIDRSGIGYRTWSEDLFRGPKY